MFFRYEASGEECRNMISIMSKVSNRRHSDHLTFEMLREFTDNYEIIVNPSTRHQQDRDSLF